jgi:hypothetical protein
LRGSRNVDINIKDPYGFRASPLMQNEQVREREPGTLGNPPKIRRVNSMQWMP